MTLHTIQSALACVIAGALAAAPLVPPHWAPWCAVVAGVGYAVNHQLGIASEVKGDKTEAAATAAVAASIKPPALDPVTRAANDITAPPERPL